MRKLSAFAVFTPVPDAGRRGGLRPTSSAAPGAVSSVASRQGARGPPVAGTAVLTLPGRSPRPYAGNFAIVSRVDRAINGVPKHKADEQAAAGHPHHHVLMDHAFGHGPDQGLSPRVAVRVIIDRDINSHNSRRLISALNGDNVRTTTTTGSPTARPSAGRATPRCATTAAAAAGPRPATTCS